jgi:SAM-dependent methyltransferase
MIARTLATAEAYQTNATRRTLPTRRRLPGEHDRAARSPVPDARAGLGPDAAIVDVGGGASRLVDDLLARGFHDLEVLDLSAEALAVAQRRLGRRAAQVRWTVADVTRFEPTRSYDLWHDRAVFHFLVRPEARAAYVRAMTRAVRPGGQAIVATFAPDGPERCSGLPVVRYDEGALVDALGPAFRRVEHLRHEHGTPAGRVQPFTFVRLQRI